jgi:phosphatidylglycerol lysyltransferase
MRSSVIQKEHGSPRAQATGKLRVVIALSVALMGVINDLTVLLPAHPGRLALLESLLNQLAPFAPSIWPVLATGRTMALILGFFLLVVAFGLARGKRSAWQFALFLLPLSALAHLAKGLAVEEALLSLLLWLGLLRGASFFHVASDPWRLRQGVVLLALGALLLAIYTVSGLSLLQAQFLLPSTFPGFVRSFLLRLVQSPASEIIPLSGHADWFLGSLAWLGAAVLLTGMVLLLRPVSARWWVAYQQERAAHMRRRLRELMRRYGNQTLSFFALAPENSRYLAPNGEGMVSYRLTGNVAVVLGDPTCPPEAIERVTQGFLDLCASNDWQVAFYQVHPEHLPGYRALGLHVFKIGEEALLSPWRFALSGSAMANVRTSCRRAEREGVTIQWYDGVPPKEVLEQLESLSSAWLERRAGKHAVEMGFSTGRLDGLAEAATRADALAETQLAGEDLAHDAVPRLVTGVATEQTGRPCAFVTFTPIYGSEHDWGWAVDLMRRALDAPPGVMELLLVRAVERFRELGANVVSLGLVAMADTKQEMPAMQRQFASLVSEQMRLLKTHRSLFYFKQKFHPCWESRYVVVSSTLALPKTALALLRVHLS